MAKDAARRTSRRVRPLKEDLITCNNCMAKVPKESIDEHRKLFHSVNKDEETVTLDEVKVQEFKVKTVCIVSFNNPELPKNVAGRFYQVTIDPEKVSPSGEFIRFGNTPGDELLGWQPTEWLTVEEILGEWKGNEPPQLEYGPSNGVTMMLGHD